MCSNSKYYTQETDGENPGKKKRCSAVVCFKPNPEKIKIIEDGKKKNGRTKFKIDPDTVDEYLYDSRNYTIYHQHRGRPYLFALIYQ